MLSSIMVGEVASTIGEIEQSLFDKFLQFVWKIKVLHAGGLMSMDVNLVSWPGITLQVSPNFYAIFWIFLILSLFLLVFSVIVLGLITMVVIVMTVKNWNLLTTVIFQPEHLTNMLKRTGGGGEENRTAGRDQVDAERNEILNGDDHNAPVSVTNPNYL